MSIMGVVPSPETAATVVAWVKALTDKDEEKTFLCLEIGFKGRTTQAVREALEDEDGGVPTLIAIDDPMPVPLVLDRVREKDTRLLVSGPFTLAHGERKKPRRRTS